MQTSLGSVASRASRVRTRVLIPAARAPPRLRRARRRAPRPLRCRRPVSRAAAPPGDRPRPLPREPARIAGSRVGDRCGDDRPKDRSDSGPEQDSFYCPRVLFGHTLGSLLAEPWRCKPHARENSATRGADVRALRRVRRPPHVIIGPTTSTARAVLRKPARAAQLRTTRSVARRGSSLSCLLLVFAGAAAQAAVQVRVEGLGEELERNVRAFLSIAELEAEAARDGARQPDGAVGEDEEGAAEARIRRLHAAAEGEIAAALQPFGYYTPAVEASLERDGEDWIARYVVDPGPPTT